MNVSYIIHKVVVSGRFFLALSLKNNEGVLSCDKKNLLAPQDKKIAEALIKDFNAHKSLKTAPLEYGKFDKVPLSDKQTSFFLMELAKVREVFFESKKIVIDVFSIARLFFDIIVSSQEALIEASVIDGLHKYPLSSVEFIGQEEVWVFHKGVLKRLKTAYKWLKMALDQEVLSAKKKEELLDSYEKGLPLDSSIPEAKFTFETPQHIAPVPCLKLKNERGLFFDLAFEYNNTLYPYLDPHNLHLNRADELFWEKALLESGIKKSGRDYFVSSIDQEKCFKVLIQQGFSIFSAKEEKVHFLHSAQGVLGEETGLGALELKLCFGQLEASLEALNTSLVQKNPFVLLDKGHVGIMPLSLFNELEVLLKGSCRGHTCYFPSHLKGDFRLSSIKIEEPPLDLKQLVFEYFNLKLLDFQKKGVSWLLVQMTKQQGCLLADDMGLGKTVQILALIDLMKSVLSKGVLIICPKSIKNQWQEAIKNILPGLSVKIDVHSFHELRAESAQCSYSLVVIDEAQAIKNMKTQLFARVCQIQADYKVALTGTPIENSFADLVALFQFLYPALIADFSGASVILNQSKIKRRLSPFILRRTKKEVLKDLPPLFEQTIDIAMDQITEELYFKVLEEARSSPVHPFALLTKLRQIALDPRLIDPAIEEMSSKTWQILEDISSIVASGQKVIVFSQFTSYLALLKTELDKRGLSYSYLDGQTLHREQAIEEFRQKTTILLMSLKAGGVGLNLQMADYVLIADPWWNRAAEQQAIDRAYRLGREGAVVARRYVTLGSLEKKIEELKASKWALLDELSEETAKQSLGLIDLLLS